MTTALSLWHDTLARQAIVDYVAAVTDQKSADFIPERYRIVVFDNDGTLWREYAYVTGTEKVLPHYSVRSQGY